MHLILGDNFPFIKNSLASAIVGVVNGEERVQEDR